jgi:hypothetical protein
MRYYNYLALFLILTSLITFFSIQPSINGISEPAFIIEADWIKAPSLQSNGIVSLKIYYQTDLKIFASKIILDLPNGVKDIYGNSLIQTTIPASSNGQIVLNIPIVVSDSYNSSILKIFGTIVWFANINNQTASLFSNFTVILPYYGYVNLGIEPNNVISHVGKDNFILLVKNLGTSILKEITISVLGKNYTFQNFLPNQIISLPMSIINFPEDLFKIKNIPVYIIYKTQYDTIETKSTLIYITILPKGDENFINVNVINSPDGITLEPGLNAVQIVLKNVFNISFNNIYLIINSTYPISNTLFYFDKWDINQTITILTYIKLTPNVNNVPISIYLLYNNSAYPKLLGNIVLPFNKLGNYHVLVSVLYNSSSKVTFAIKNLLRAPISNLTISIMSGKDHISKSFPNLIKNLEISFDIPNNANFVNYTITYYIEGIQFNNSGSIKMKVQTYPIVKIIDVTMLDKIPLGNNMIKAVLAVTIKNLGNDTARNVQLIMKGNESQLDQYVVNLGDLQANRSIVQQVFLIYDDREDFYGIQITIIYSKNNGEVVNYSYSKIFNNLKPKGNIILDVLTYTIKGVPIALLIGLTILALLIIFPPRVKK